MKQLAEDTLERKYDHQYLFGTSGKVWGAMVLSSETERDPLIVSIGTKICLDTAIEVVKACIKEDRIPEPIRLADTNSREEVKIHYDYKTHKRKYQPKAPEEAKSPEKVGWSEDADLKQELDWSQVGSFF